MIKEVLSFFHTNSDTITAFSAVGALLISAIAITMATRDNQKQIRVGKIEEIYELLIYFIVEYNSMYELSLKLDACGDETDGKYNEKIKQYNLELKDLKKNIDLDDLFNKVIRLNVLSNSYLSSNLQFQVLAYARLFECLIVTLQIGKLTRKQKEYSEGFPQVENIRNVCTEITCQLVEKINLGGENQKHKDFLIYRETIFKKSLKLK
jgi:hypothetical protein